MADSPMATMQGIVVPQQSVNPAGFFALTRRKRNMERNATYAGLGGHDAIELRKADILAGLRVRFVGTVVTTGTTVKPTYQWPHNLIGEMRFTANGQSSLCQASGLSYKLREFMVENASDRGVSRNVGSSTVTQGTLSKSSESWGVYPNKAAAAGTYDVDIDWLVPIVEDQKDLAGAIFAQTSTQDLVLNIDWNDEGTLFTGTDGSNKVTVSGKLIVEAESYSIPSVGSDLVLPDLSLFHGFIETRNASGLAAGANGVRLVGQGAGRALIRVFYNIWSGSTPAPLSMDADNYTLQAWQYGSNETPESYPDGQSIRLENENTYGVDIANVWGFAAHDFAVRNAFRDTVDMGQTAELRLVVGLAPGVSLTNPVLVYTQETMFRA